MNEVINKILELLESGLSGQYNHFVYGENFVPNQQLFPFLEVVPVGTETTNRGTGGMKNDLFTVRVQIKDTVKNYVGQSDEEVHKAMQSLVLRMEKRTNGNLDSDCVLGVLSDNLRLDDSINIVDNWNVSYNILPYNGSWVILGSVQFLVSNISY